MDLARNLIGRINVGDSLTRSAATRPGQLAVVDGDRRLTYRDFNAYVNRIAHGLAGLGYERGATLAVASGNSADFLAVYYACAKLGVVCVPVNLGWRPDEVAYVLGHSRARGIVVETQLVATMRDAIAKVPEVLDVIVAPGTQNSYEAEPADRAWTTVEALSDHDRAAEPGREVDDRDALSYLYTSGTTSFPKGVVGSHLAIYLESMSGALDSGWNAGDRFAAMMPMFHTAQLNAFCTPAILVGATIYVLRGFDPGVLLDLIEREQITQIFGLPMMYQAMLDHETLEGPRSEHPAPRGVRNGAHARRPDPPLPGRLRLRLRAAVRADRDEPDHHVVPARASAVPHRRGGYPADRRPGRDHGPGRRRAAARRDRRDRLPGAEHHVRIPVRRGRTDQAFAYGWFHSGDVGRFDDDGVLWFTDRYKDVIKTGGENVASIEVEKAVYAADPRVAEVVVVGLPHQRWSEAVTAFVVPKPGETIDAAELIAAVKTRLDGFKVPKDVVFVDRLPKTSTGKIQKNVVRSEHARHYQEG